MAFSDDSCSACNMETLWEDRNKGSPHYFKIDIVFEAHSKKDAEAITKITQETVEEIRRIVKDYPVVGLDRATLMAYIKRDLKTKMNNVLSGDVVVEVYFKSFLGQ